jgi:hypothetical protein
VVLGQVVAAKRQPVGELQQPQALLVPVGQVAAALVQPVEHAEADLVSRHDGQCGRLPADHTMVR